MRGRRIAGLVGIVVLTASACASLPERQSQVRSVAERFESEVRHADAAALCKELAPGTREELEASSHSACEKAIGDEGLVAAGGVRHTDVYGDQARVVLDKDTLFLSRFPAGWKLTAAGCTPQPGQPYQCAIKGG